MLPSVIKNKEMVENIKSLKQPPCPLQKNFSTFPHMTSRECLYSIKKMVALHRMLFSFQSMVFNHNYIL